MHHLLEQSLNKTGLLSSSVLYRFEQGNPVQTILHELKYKNNRSIGLYFGSLIGKEFERKQLSHSIEALIPVPIHHRKRFDRGYNQSELLARGISSVTSIPIKTVLLSKNRNTKSQTKLSKEQRRENTIDTFSVSDEVKKYASIALVDDVVTTGATISTICDVLKEKNENLQITIFSLSIANNNS
ncbi:MAG: ComF family protein [Crocinitomicaceae bacterium]|nr:ComF family protein [Crocinitomicaceae bacterium]